MSPRLECVDLGKKFGDFAAVSGVTLGFEPGRIHAIMGENGAGKSTLLKMLFGLESPTSGEILLDGRAVRWRNSMDAIEAGLGMVQQHFSLVGNLSAIDNIMLGAEKMKSLGRLDRSAAIAYLESILPSDNLAVPWTEQIDSLSVGYRQRVEILKLLFRKAGVLFLDEPTAVLTPQEVREFFDVLRKLRDEGRTIVVVTHKIREVRELCDTYAVLRQGRLAGQGHVAQSTDDELIDKMIGRRLESKETKRVAPGARIALKAERLSEDSIERGRMADVSLEVHESEIVGIAGVDGSGQSHLVDAIMGLRAFRGDLAVMGRPIEPKKTRLVRETGLGLVPEDRLRQGLWAEESCYNNMIIGLEDEFLAGGVLKEDAIRTTTNQWAKDFDVRASSLENTAGSLSGGNQQKLVFAREVAGRRPRFLICHQPTRGVDLGAVDLIHEKVVQLRNQGLGVLLISSDLDELLKLSDKIYVLFEGRVSAVFGREEFDVLKIGAAMTGVVHA